MLDEPHLLNSLSVQDRDLLSRLSQYFDSLETRLREGQGWFIFNARGERSARILRYISSQLAGFRPLVSSFHVGWRDFALHSYVFEVELAGWPQEGSPGTSEHVKEEHRIAIQVSRSTDFHLPGPIM